MPFTDAEIDYAADDLKMVLDPDLAFFAFVDGEPAGFSLAVPDFNQVLRRMKRVPVAGRHPHTSSTTPGCMSLPTSISLSLRRGPCRMETLSWPA